MTISILVLKEAQAAYELAENLSKTSVQIMKFELIEPPQGSNGQSLKDLVSIQTDSSNQNLDLLKRVSINDVCMELCVKDILTLHLVCNINNAVNRRN